MTGAGEPFDGLGPMVRRDYFFGFNRYGHSLETDGFFAATRAYRSPPSLEWLANLRTHILDTSVWAENRYYSQKPIFLLTFHFHNGTHLSSYFSFAQLLSKDRFSARVYIVGKNNGPIHENLFISIKKGA